MRKITALLILVSILFTLPLCACGKEEELGEWQMPEVDARPTTAPTAAPAFGGGSTARYIWNEAVSINMSDPGVSAAATTKTLTHAETLALFGGQFLPKTIFNESYGAYSRMYLEQVKHEVLINADGGLAENAYVEYRYLNKDWVEAASITVCAELISYERVQEIYDTRAYPHISYPEGTNVQFSSYYLQSFVLTRIGDARCAQWLAVPSSYLSYIDEALKKAEEEGTQALIPPVPLLTFSCREKVSDEQLIAAVCEIGSTASASVYLPPLNEKKLPKPGEKGAA